MQAWAIGGGRIYQKIRPGAGIIVVHIRFEILRGFCDSKSRKLRSPIALRIARDGERCPLPGLTQSVAATYHPESRLAENRCGARGLSRSTTTSKSLDDLTAHSRYSTGD